LETWLLAGLRYVCNRPQMIPLRLVKETQHYTGFYS